MIQAFAVVVAAYLTYRGCLATHRLLNPAYMFRVGQVSEFIRTLMWFTAVVSFTQWSLGSVPALIAAGVLFVAAVAPWYRDPYRDAPDHGPVSYAEQPPVPAEPAAPRAGGHPIDVDQDDGQPAARVTGTPALTRDEEEQFASIVRRFDRAN